MPQLTPNLLKTWTDIRNNPEHWNQKFSLIEFHDPNKKPWWTKDYSFIPHWKRFKACQEWIKNTKFPEYNCKIGWNANNEILLVTQNYFGGQRLGQEQEKELLGKIRKKIHTELNQVQAEINRPTQKYTSQEKKDILAYEVELKESLKASSYEELGDFSFSNIYGEELGKLRSLGKNSGGSKSFDLSRNDIALLWKKQLYFITSFTYTNNYKLTVEIRARKCQLFLSYYNWIKSAGCGTVNQAPQLIKDDHNRLHYDFCGDLGIKKIVQASFQSYQPKFQLFRAQVRYKGGTRNITWSDQVATGRNAEPKQLSIPSDIKLSKFDEAIANETSRGWLNDFALMSMLRLGAVADFTGGMARKIGQMLLDAKCALTVGPTEMTDLSKAYFSQMFVKEEVLFTSNPTFAKWLKEQPHLWDHTTFQFYLFNKITMTANGRYLGIKEKGGRFILPYKLFINYAPGNLYYRWEFNFITVKCEVSNEGTFEDWTNPARVMRGFNFSIGGGGQVLGTGGKGKIAFGSNWNDVGEEAGKMKAGDDPAAEQEAQTERMFKNTFRSFNDKSVEPAQFNANTIDFHYSLGEFFNRLTDPVFFYRIEISELLYNRLNWANNKSTPLNLPLSWKELGTWTQKEGFWKWSGVYLEKDKDDFWSNIMGKGYWLNNGTELTNPKLAFAHASSSVQIGGNAWNIRSGEEELIEKREKVVEDLIKADTSAMDYGIADYIGSLDANLWAQMPHVHHRTEGSGGVSCLGCLTGGGHAHGGTTDFEIPMEFSSGGTILLKTRNSGLQSATIPKQGGKAIFWCKGSQGGIRLEYEKITYETKINKNPNDIKQEIDQEMLENEVEDEMEEEIEGENEEEIEKGVGVEKEVEPELEDEPEQEEEKEQEEEQEKETEKEKEDEKETEQEKEKEPEKEDEKESEKEDESEDEDEEEREI